MGPQASPHLGLGLDRCLHCYPKSNHAGLEFSGLPGSGGLITLAEFPRVTEGISRSRCVITYRRNYDARPPQIETEMAAFPWVIIASLRVLVNSVDLEGSGLTPVWIRWLQHQPDATKPSDSKSPTAADRFSNQLQPRPRRQATLSGQSIVAQQPMPVHLASSGYSLQRAILGPSVTSLMRSSLPCGRSFSFRRLRRRGLKPARYCRQRRRWSRELT